MTPAIATSSTFTTSVPSLATELLLRGHPDFEPVGFIDRFIAASQQKILKDKTLFVPNNHPIPLCKPLRKVAIYGGSFNPPHNGHRNIVLSTLHLDCFDEVWMFPAFSHAFGKHLLPFEDRTQMSALLFAGITEPRLRICRIEEKLNKSPCYTYDTVHALKDLFPAVDFTFVAGADIEREIDQWTYIDELRSIAKIFFLPRDESGISSTQVRHAIKNGEDISRYAPREVIDYIRENKFYL